MPDLLRPEPRTSWRVRAQSLVASVSPARVATGAGAVLLLAVTAWWLLRSPAPPVERTLPVARSTTTIVAGVTSSASVAATVAPSTTAVEVMVQAAGAVMAPGVYRLPLGARVQDVITAAGGPTGAANLQAVALASKVVDGQRIYVPALGEAAGAQPAPPGPAPPLDLNQATLEQLEALPGVGPTTAQAIIDYRSRHGPLSSVDDLLDVRGIGPAKLDGFRDLVTVG
ncbi:MAG TPA: helix-hairpin-helix domain-containing protein [Acidimicrobiales bacterium]